MGGFARQQQSTCLTNYFFFFVKNPTGGCQHTVTHVSLVTPVISVTVLLKPRLSEDIR
jgi:hypothetical protein